MRDECIPYLMNDVLFLIFIYARYTMNLWKITGFGIKYGLPLPPLAWQFFISMRVKEEGSIYMHTHTDIYMRHFVNQVLKRVKVVSLDQNYESENLKIRYLHLLF